MPRGKPEPSVDDLVAQAITELETDGSTAVARICAEHPDHAEQLLERLARLGHLGLLRSGDADDVADHPRQIGPYKILEPLGEGGMGTVYLAEQSRPVNRRVALKLIKLGMDSKAVVARFQQERQALALMSHEGIAQVYDCGTNDRGQPFFVMELVKGIPLDRFCDQHRLSLTDRLELMQQVCGAVQHAHQKGVVHRDLKPGNILVADDGGRRQVKVIDFGLAKAMGQKLVEATLFTEAGQVVGTPEYMAPEQADPTNQDIDTRADIYSLGVTLYELLVGELPFPALQLRRAGMLEVQRILREEDPPRPSTRLSSIGEASSQLARTRRTSVNSLRKALRTDLDWVVLKALEKERNRRYDTANAMSADLQRFLDHEPLSAGPPSAAYRLKKLARRYRPQLLASVAVLVTAVVGAVFSINFAITADAERRTAQRETSEARSLAMAAAANDSLANQDTDLAIRLALQSADMESPPAEAQAALARAAYAPWRTRKRFDPEEGRISSISATPDGAYVLASVADHSIIVWRQSDSSEAARLVGHEDLVTAVAVSPDGRSAISGSSDATLIVWDLVTFRRRALLRGHSGRILDVRFHPASPHQALSCSADNTVIVWDLKEQQEVRRLRQQFGPLACFDISRDGKLVAFGTRGGASGWWNLETGDVEKRFPHRAQVRRVAFVPPANFLLAASGQGELGLWHLDPENQWRYRFLGDNVAHSQMIDSLCVDANGVTAASGGWDSKVVLWDLKTFRPVQSVIGHRAPVTGVCFSGRQFVSGSLDGTVRIWDLASPAEITRITAIGDVPMISSSAVTADGRQVIAAARNRLLRWDIARARERKGTQHEVLLQTNLPIYSIASDAGGHLVLMGYDSGGKVELRDLRAESVRQLRGHGDAGIKSVAIDSGSKRGLSGGWDNQVILWDLEQGEELRRFALEAAVWSVAFHPNKNTALAALENGKVLYLDLATGSEIRRMHGHKDAAYAVAFSPDGLTAVSGAADRHVILWDIETGDQIKRFDGHSGPIRAVSFDRRGQSILTGSEDMTVRLWDVESATEMTRFQGHEFGIRTVGFVPDGKTVFSGGWDGNLILWDLPPSLEGLIKWTHDNRYVRELTPQERERYL